MDWKVVGAVEQTGDEVTRTFDARDRADAEAKARRAGILVSSIEPVEDVNNLGVLDYRGRPDTSPLFPLPKPAPAAPAPAPPPPAPAATPKRRQAPLPVSRAQLTLLVALIAALLLFHVVTWVIDHASPTRWEYKIEAPSDRVFETEIDRLGADGWELVTARRVAPDDGGPGAKYELIFKRLRR
jgi:hypothetical protein